LDHWRYISLVLLIKIKIFIWWPKNKYDLFACCVALSSWAVTSPFLHSATCW